MSRRTVVLIAAAIGLGYLATVGLALATWNQHRTLDAIQADLAATRAQLQGQTVKGTPTPSATLPPSAPANTGQAVYPSMKSMSDSLGNTWRQAMMVTADLKEGTVITFTASAGDPLNRPLQYKFWAAPNPLQAHLLCDWGGPSCTWTAVRLVNCAACQTLIMVAIRVAGSTRWRLDTCFPNDPCDDVLQAQYVFTS